jgi:CRP-like cAMP-binding protein
MTGTELNAIMMKTRPFSGFTSEECTKLRAFSQAAALSCETDEIIAAEGSTVDFFAIILRGRLLCEKNNYNGRVELIQNCSPGDTVCLDIVCTATRRCPFRLICIKRTELLVFRYDALMRRDIISDGLYERLRTNIIDFLANENIKKLYKVDVLYKRSLRERILVFLRSMEARTGESTLRIHMDREQFAQYLGVNRSSLSHELSLMRAEGLLSFSKDCFVLLKQSEKSPDTFERPAEE